MYKTPEWVVLEGIPWLVTHRRRVRGHWERCSHCGSRFASVFVQGSVVSGRVRGLYCGKSCAALARHAALPRQGRPDLFQNMTPDEAWLCGIIWSDGSLDPIGRTASMPTTFNVTTGTTDAQIAAEIGRISGSPVRAPKPQPGRRQAYRTYISGLPVQRLIGMGLTRGKTLHCAFPDDIAEPLLRHFLRGFFDGDGTVGIYRVGGNPRLTSGICGTRDFLNDLQDRCIVPAGIARRSPSRHASIFKLQYNHYDSLRLADLMYGQGGVALERKRTIFQRGREIAPPRAGF